MRRLKEELPSVAHFCTLSPIPGFRPWLLAAVKMDEGDLFLPSEVDAFRDFFAVADRAQTLGAVADSIRTNAWTADSELTELLERPLMRLCARCVCVCTYRLRLKRLLLYFKIHDVSKVSVGTKVGTFGLVSHLASSNMNRQDHLTLNQ